MNDELLKKNKTAIVIVAHPDDETIWMGGCLLRYKNIDWTCFSLCRSSDADRAPKFKKVCKHYEAKSVMTDLDDEDKIDLDKAVSVAKRLILKKIEGKNYDYIFTHGSNGEYGHSRHIAVNKAIKELIAEKKLKPEAVFYFSYKNKKNQEYKVESQNNSNLLLELSSEELEEKKRIVSRMHGYPMEGIDVGYCTNPESFLVKKYNN